MCMKSMFDPYNDNSECTDTVLLQFFFFQTNTEFTPCLTERLLMGRKESNQIKQTY